MAMERGPRIEGSGPFDSGSNPLGAIFFLNLFYHLPKPGDRFRRVNKIWRLILTRMGPPLSISDSVATAEWDSLAHAMKSLATGVDAKDARTRSLRTRAGMVRMILYDKLRGFNGDNSIDLAFFIASFRAISRIETDFDSHQVKSREFVIFLKLLLRKFGQQRLMVKKPRAMLDEFGRMKGVVENGHGTL
jgi:hypothetical protein